MRGQRKGLPQSSMSAVSHMRNRCKKTLRTLSAWYRRDEGLNIAGIKVEGRKLN
jgi:hypothetical protein